MPGNKRGTFRSIARNSGHFTNQDSNLCLLLNSYREISANHALTSLAAQSLARTLVSLVKPYDSYYEVVEPVHNLIYPSRVTTETNNQPSSTPVLCFSFLSKCPFLFLSRHFQDRVKGSGRSAVPPSIWATGQTVVAVRNDCDFDEQCSMTTPQTECRDGKCMCQGNMYPYVKDNITQCFVRGEKKIGDKCEESLDCGYDGGVCDKTKKPICQCSPELPVTNHIDKCGKGKMELVSEGLYDGSKRVCVELLDRALVHCDGNTSAVRPDVSGVVSKIGREGELTNHATEQQRSERRIFEAGLDACAGSSYHSSIVKCGPSTTIKQNNDRIGLATIVPSFNSSARNFLDRLVLVSEGAINESCFFNEQCEHVNYQTECRDGRCMCRYELTPVTKQDGTVDCIAPQTDHGPPQYVDPAMIGVLVGMALMFIIICVVLRLFSK
uniref:EB domain-containing protein n=1 Tax=Timema monikensis TaxID=170555 RepID=A0A7R9E199_9NEOP|nr:unnamed protein product [Timema monikensis]